MSEQYARGNKTQRRFWVLESDLPFYYTATSSCVRNVVNLSCWWSRARCLVPPVAVSTHVLRECGGCKGKEISTSRPEPDREPFAVPKTKINIFTRSGSFFSKGYFLFLGLWAWGETKVLLINNRFRRSSLIAFFVSIHPSPVDKGDNIAGERLYILLTGRCRERMVSIY